MFNLALGLALLTYWASYYFALPAYGIHEFGFAVVPLAVLGISLVAWMIVLQIYFSEKKEVQAKPWALLLLVGNIWSLCTIGLHIHRSILQRNAVAFEEVMPHGVLDMLNICFTAFYPFAKLLVVVIALGNIYSLYRNRRSRDSGFHGS